MIFCLFSFLFVFCFHCVCQTPKYKNTNLEYTNTSFAEMPERSNMWYIFEKRIVQGYLLSLAQLYKVYFSFVFCGVGVGGLLAEVVGSNYCCCHQLGTHYLPSLHQQKVQKCKSTKVQKCKSTKHKTLLLTLCI